MFFTENKQNVTIIIIIYCMFKMNPAVTYEIDYYVFDQGIIFILTRDENLRNRNF